MRTSRHRARGGFILLGVLILVMLVSMIAMSLMFRLRADETATAASSSGDQAFAAAMTGIQEAMQAARDIQPGFTDWEDDPRRFRDRLVYDDGSDQWHFTVWSPAARDSDAEVRFGLTDEARKINVNAIRTLDLSKLPNMTSQLAAAVKDFVDFDDFTTADGAEQDYYNSLPLPYTIRNAALPSLDSLLLVRGFTPELLYGEDVNMNWRLDLNENDGAERPPMDNSDGALDLGLSRFLTVFSNDPDQDHDGVPRTDLNDPADPYLGVEFPTAMTNFINEVRKANIKLAHAADLLEATIKVKDQSGREREVASGVGKAELEQALDLFTTSAEFWQPGLINVNTASLETLTAIPGVDQPLAEAIQSTRKSISPERRATIAWLFQENVVDAPTFKRLAPFLCARSFQFSFQVIGYGYPSGRFRRLEVVIDSSEGSPRVVYLRDLTRLGMPFRIEPQTIEPVEQARGTGKPENLNRG